MQYDFKPYCNWPTKFKFEGMINNINESMQNNNT